MYSVQEASEKLGLDPSQVRRLLRSGEIKGKKLARDWVVLSLDYKRKRRPKAVRDETARVKFDLELNIGAGTRPGRRPRRIEYDIIQLVVSKSMTLRELIDTLIFDGKMSRRTAENIIKGAISAGIIATYKL